MNRSDFKFIRNPAFPILILILIHLLFNFLFYGSIILHPDQHMFGISGDGIKNYFTYAWHIRYGSGLIDFEGMNYPYGEHFLYTDGHPVFIAFLRLLSNFSSWFSEYCIALLNSWLILSSLLSSFFLYLILRLFKTASWFAVLAALTISILSPQLFRLTGHFALSYSYAIPLSIYLCVLTAKRKSWAAVFLGLHSLFFLFVHAYLGIMIVGLSIIYLFLKLFDFGPNGRNKKSILVALLLCICSMLFFFLFVQWTDIHPDRTSNPAGFFLYNAEIDDLLLPAEGPVRKFIDSISPVEINLKWEARAYLGIPSVIFLLSILFSSFISIFSKKLRNRLTQIFWNRNLNLFLISATILLLFAFAFPFKQFRELIEWLPIVKNFRATGRFTWPFYFCFQIFVAVYLFQWLEKSGEKWNRLKKMVFALFLISISIIEGTIQQGIVSKSIKQYPNLFNKSLEEEFYEENGHLIDLFEYQALISLPYFHHGSESFDRLRHDAAVRNVLCVSYYTGLPVLNANLTRVSILESKKLIQLASPNYYPKLIKGDFQSDKDFLIVKSHIQLSQYEEMMLEKSTLLSKWNGMEFYKISKSDLLSDDRGTVIQKFQEQQESLFLKKGFLTTDSSKTIIYKDFEEKTSDTSFRGEGSFYSFKKRENKLAYFAPNTFETDKEYELSIWMFNGEPDALNLWFRLIVEEFDEESGQWFNTTFFPEFAETIYGDWSLIEGKFRVHNGNNAIQLVTKGKTDSKAAFHADDLLVKEVGLDVFRIEKDSSLFFNNHWIK